MVRYEENGGGKASRGRERGRERDRRTGKQIEKGERKTEIHR